MGPLIYSAKMYTAVLFFVVYIFLCMLILMNVLLAILVDSFAAIKEEQTDSMSVKQELGLIGQAIMNGPLFNKNVQSKDSIFNSLSQIRLTTIRRDTNAALQQYRANIPKTSPTSSATLSGIPEPIITAAPTGHLDDHINVAVAARHLQWMASIHTRVGNQRLIKGLTEDQMYDVISNKIDRTTGAIIDTKTQGAENITDAEKADWANHVGGLKNEARLLVRSLYMRFSERDKDTKHPDGSIHSKLEQEGEHVGALVIELNKSYDKLLVAKPVARKKAAQIVPAPASPFKRLITGTWTKKNARPASSDEAEMEVL